MILGMVTNGSKAVAMDFSSSLFEEHSVGFEPLTAS